MSGSTTVRINRAPVLTLWAAVVAERLGMSRETALTVGQALAGITAHAKGVRLGIYAPPGERPREAAGARSLRIAPPRRAVSPLAVHLSGSALPGACGTAYLSRSLR
jgi:hypothetical protein